MRLPTSNSNSYFALASIHQLPENPGGGGLYCQHHDMLYNPWHRAYMNLFEDALRSVPGCENVTLPYWDITSPPPAYLFKPPFDSYKLPKGIGPGYSKGYNTKRNSSAAIVRKVNDPLDNIPDTINTAMKQPIWRDFVSYTKKGIEAAHDSGHVAIGETMRRPDAAAFDPIFWFFHSNWDRLWGEWQERMSVTSVWFFRSTILGNTRFLDSKLLNKLEPFGLVSTDVIALEKMDIGYELPKTVVMPKAETSVFGSFAMRGGVRVHNEAVASARVKNINRAKIPGTFSVVLKANRKIIGKRAFFQPTNPEICPGCKEKVEISLDFIVSSKQIVEKNLKIEIELIGYTPKKERIIPLESIGEPSINIRYLLKES